MTAASNCAPGKEQLLTTAALLPFDLQHSECADSLGIQRKHSSDRAAVLWPPNAATRCLSSAKPPFPKSNRSKCCRLPALTRGNKIAGIPQTKTETDEHEEGFSIIECSAIENSAHLLLLRRITNNELHAMAVRGKCLV